MADVQKAVEAGGDTGHRTIVDLPSLATFHAVRYAIWGALLLAVTLAFGATGIIANLRQVTGSKSVIESSGETFVASMYLLAGLCALVMWSMALFQLLKGRDEFGAGHRRAVGAGLAFLGAGALVFAAGAAGGNIAVGVPAGPLASAVLSALGAALFALGLAIEHWAIGKPLARRYLAATAALVTLAPLPMIASPGPTAAISSHLLGVLGMVAFIIAMRDVYGRILIGETKPAVEVGEEGPTPHLARKPEAPAKP